MAYDFSKKFMDIDAMDSYEPLHKHVAKEYGPIVKAMPLSNREYQHRYDKLRSSRNMKKPPSSNRIFPGYLVVRNLGTSNQYETWFPDGAFEESYRKQ